MATTTLQNFGVPLGGGAGRGGILQPKPKHRFRVRVIGFGPVAGGLELTQQVQTVARPTSSQSPVEVHSYNSVAYYAGKHSWGSVELSVRDDVTNSVNALVGHQLMKQMNFFEQTTALAGSDYKFEMYVETLDGGNDGVLEQWYFEGCFLEQVNYGQFDYATADAMMIEMTVRYDNATQSGGLMPVNPELKSGAMV
jgi:hypothetical protein